LRLSLEFIPGQVVTLLETFYRTQKPGDVKVENGFCFEMIPDGRGISVKDQEVIQPQGRGVEKVRLEGQSVPIAARKGENRLHSSGLE
jgi:hypothetical protein